MMLKLPVIQGLLDRRILLNYSFDPESLREYLPPPFEPKLHNGRGVAGICMIRFKAMRPRGFPGFLGFGSENAAHRVAVQWPGEEGPMEGVFIPHRETASALNLWAGGRMFPGLFRRSRFTVKESDGRYHIEIAAPGEKPHVVFDGEDATGFPASSIFSGLEEASNFFENGACGYSPAKIPGAFQGMELRLRKWRITPLKINDAFVGLYEDGKAFPKGAARIDNALLMSRLEHEWIALPGIGA